MVTDDIEFIQKQEPEFRNAGEVFAHTYFGSIKDWQCIKIIFNFNNSHSKITHGCVAHECIHACNMILEHRGIISSFNNDEAQAYFLEWIVNECYKFFDKIGCKVELKAK